jgi:NTE family protein
MISTTENVLILQGGGSLGAFGCGVFKALVNNNIKIDIIAGTSIGGINASVIAGSKDEEHPEKALEEFWLELAEGSNTNLNFPDYSNSTIDSSTLTRLSQAKSTLSFYGSAFHGNKKVFVPRWSPVHFFTDSKYCIPDKWTYLFDHSPLIKTLEKYVDFNKLRPNGNPYARLIITAVSVLTAEPLTFDSAKKQITPKHILATTAYPTYYFPWIEVEKGTFAWDGSLLSNTPLREVIDASPIKDKRIFLVENYPKNIDRLPDNIQEVQHRARDIMFSDKTIHDIKMSRIITYHLRFIDELYHMLENRFDLKNEDDREMLDKIRAKYKKISEEHGAEIKSLYYISRDESSPSLYENADFSRDTIKNSIKNGELKTNKILQDNKMKT